MLGLPRRTEVNKRINKTVIYEKFQLEPKQKEAFDADVSFILPFDEDLSSRPAAVLLAQVDTTGEKSIQNRRKIAPPLAKTM